LALIGKCIGKCQNPARPAGKTNRASAQDSAIWTFAGIDHTSAHFRIVFQDVDNGTKIAIPHTAFVQVFRIRRLP